MGNLDKLRPNMADVRDCRRGSVDRRGSIDTLKDHCEMAPDHEHLFKKVRWFQLSIDYSIAYIQFLTVPLYLLKLSMVIDLC